MKKTALTILIVLYSILASSQMPQVSSGTIKRIENFKSQFVTERNVDVWLPEGYSDKKKYAVLYMHDGQMLYDSTTTWNKQAWEVDDILAKLMKEKKIKDVIVVGVWNGEFSRRKDYLPQKPFESLSQLEKDTVNAQLQRTGSTKEVFNPGSDNYLKFLVTELKPFIDKKYSTNTDKKNTFIAGSSMGGLISMYAICEYPDIFGGAACLSTHWPGIFSLKINPLPDAFVNYLNDHLPSHEKNKIYFDYGDQTLDSLYAPLQKKVDDTMKQKGFNEKNWMTRYFPGEYHSERAWRKRFDIPMLFLLKK